jgi:uncharacterized protein (DUF2235 family)
MNRSPKNIVVCCDGTGNDYSQTPSNVLRLHGFALERRGVQVGCYHPGIGTLDRPEGRTRLGRRVRHWRELGFGTGVIENVVDLYAYLMREYEPGDRIFLIGFSRGAFTARAVAGMLHVCGLLRREDAHLIAHAIGLYRTSELRIQHALRRAGLQHAPKDDHDHARHDARAREFRKTLSRPCPVHFLGLWDTVKAYGWIWPQSFPALRHNPDVRAVRHAVALDERRAVFQMTGWGDRPAAGSAGGDPQQTVQEVWFAGDHSDVGGGNESGNSALSDASMTWMLGEATHAGLILNESCRAEIDQIIERSPNASSVTPNDLRSSFWYTKLLPRTELDNSTYPPRHRPTWFWADGRRQPARHAEGSAVFLHESVRARGGAYLPQQLRARTRVARMNPEPRFEYTGNRDVVYVEWVDPPHNAV